MRILICGDRNWTNSTMIWNKLRQLHNEIALGTGNLDMPTTEITVIDGAARGSDTLAHKCAERLGMRTQRFPAEWDKYGKAAGPIRNRQMLDEGKPDLVWAFHNDIKNSKGTANMVQQAKARGIPYEVFTE